MKTNFERVKDICDSGKIALIEGDNEALPYISIIKTFGEVYRISQPQRTKGKALENIGYRYADLEEINELDIKSITPINYPPHNIKVGEKVRILECTRELDNYLELHKNQKEMVGNWGYYVEKIKNTNYGNVISITKKIEVFQNDKNTFIFIPYDFPISCVCLDWED